MQNQVIAIENLTKTYQLYGSPIYRVIEAFHPLKKQYHNSFDALKDVSFSVKKGSAFGIIGRNGGGKSTLLQVITGILQPSSGKVEVDGKIAALLELGAGFNPDFTGRENVYLNGSILGFSRKEMDERFDEIAAFADIGDFIEQPVKRYSSGMYVRLAFAVQACVEPDILIIDEALSVGDVFFQQKCLKRMQELREKGVTLLFVSHDMAAIRDLCDNTLYLRNGKCEFVGPTQKAIQLYFQEDLGQDRDQNSTENHVKQADLSLPDVLKENTIWNNGSDGFHGSLSDGSKIVAVGVYDENNEPTMRARIGEKRRGKIYFFNASEVPIHVSLTIKNRYDQVVTSTGSYILGVEQIPVKQQTLECFELEVECNIESGTYTFNAGLSYDGDKPNRGVVIDEIPWQGPLTITWDYEKDKAPFLGMFQIPAKGKFFKIPENVS